MISRQQWSAFLNLTPSDFVYPDQLRFDIVSALDRFIGMVGAKPVMLSDYRPGDPRQHGKGTAVDATWPDREPLEIWNLALGSRLFNGLGIYLNEREVVSFHFDTRVGRTPDSPALWGALITYPYDADSQRHLRRDEYTTAQAVIDVLKKKQGTFVLAAAVLAFALYLWSRSNP